MKYLIKYPLVLFFLLLFSESLFSQTDKFLAPQYRLNQSILLNTSQLISFVQSPQIKIKANYSRTFFKELQNAFQQLELLRSDEIVKSLISRINKGQRDAISFATVDRRTKTISILFNENGPYVRFQNTPEGIKYVTIEEEPQGTMTFDSLDRALNTVASIGRIYIQLSREGGQINLSDINNHRFFIPTDQLNEQEFPEDEMFFILSMLNEKLDDALGTQNLRYSRRPILKTFLWNKKNQPYDVTLATRVRAAQHRDLFRNYDLSPERDQLNVYLARDGLSAMEFHYYLDGFLGKKHISRAMYQPGRPPDGRGSNYESTESLTQTLKLLKSLYLKVIKDFRSLRSDLSESLVFDPKINDMRLNKGTKDKADETQFKPIVYGRFSKAFKEAYIQALNEEENSGLRKELTYIWKQFRHVGIENFPDTSLIVLIDLNATGKTIFYLKSALEILSDTESFNKLKTESGELWDELQEIETFSSKKRGKPYLGFGRGEQNYIPKLAHELGHSVNDFPDVNWSMEMSGRNTENGEVLFQRGHQIIDGNPSYNSGVHRFHVLNQAFQSLLLHNAALRHSRALKKAQEKEILETLRQNVQKEILDVDVLTLEDSFDTLGFAIPGFLGKSRNDFFEKMNAWYGESNWQFAHILKDGTIISSDEVYRYIEKSYEDFFLTPKGHEALLSLLENAKDIYVGQPNQVQHGLSYLSQKNPSYQFQATAIRRVVDKLWRNSSQESIYQWQGNRLIPIRGLRAENIPMSAGQVDFIQPKIIPNTAEMEREDISPWREGSIAHFYYATRVIMRTSDLDRVLREQERRDGPIKSITSFLRYSA